MEMPTSCGIIDVWGIKSGSSSNTRRYESIAIEVKVSRNDYRSRSQKYKEHVAEHIANYCYILCPEYMIGEHYDSPNWGIIWWNEKTNRLRVVRKPVFHDQTERSKLEIMINLFENRANCPDRLIEDIQI